MTNLIDQLQEILAVFEAKEIEYALCGGIAVNIYGHPRTTRDIDFLVLGKDVERIYQALEDIGFVFRAGPMPFGVGSKNYREIYRISKPEGTTLLMVDLLIVTPVFEDVWQGKQRYEWRGQSLFVVSLEGLTKMKLLGGRYQDLADLENLGVEAHDDLVPTSDPLYKKD